MQRSKPERCINLHSCDVYTHLPMTCWIELHSCIPEVARLLLCAQVSVYRLVQKGVDYKVQTGVEKSGLHSTSSTNRWRGRVFLGLFPGKKAAQYHLCMRTPDGYITIESFAHCFCLCVPMAYQLRLCCL